MSRGGSKPKRGVRQSERIDIRVTSAMKQQLKLASKVSSAGTVTDFIQGLTEVVAPAVIDLNECRMTPEAFKVYVAEQIYVLASPSPSVSPSPECEESEDGEGE